MKCLFLSDDLLFAQQVANAITESGCDNKTVSNLSQIRSAIEEGHQPNVIVVDLSLAGLAFAEVVELAHRESASCIGIVSHVHQGKIERAKAAGFDHILTRGQIADRLGQIIKD